MTPEIEDFFRDTLNIRRALKQIFPPEAADHIVTLIVLDNLTRKSKKNQEEPTMEGDESANE
jgi:hypothetical protein